MVACRFIDVISVEVSLGLVRFYRILLRVKERRHVSFSHSFTVSMRYDVSDEIKTLHESVDHLVITTHHVA